MVCRPQKTVGHLDCLFETGTQKDIPFFSLIFSGDEYISLFSAKISVINKNVFLVFIWKFR